MILRVAAVTLAQRSPWPNSCSAARNRFIAGFRYARFQFGVQHHLHHSILHPEFEHPGMELFVSDLSCDPQECLSGRSHRAGQDHAGHDVVLVSNRAERQNVCLRRGLENSQPRRVGVVNDQVRALADLRQRRLFGGSHVVEFANITDQQASSWPHRKETALEPLEGQPDRRQFDPSDRSYHSGPRDAAGQHAFGVRRLIEFESQRRDIARRLAA